MELNAFIPRMTASARRLQMLADCVSDEQARWKPNPDSWSILEVMHHLWDEEREDFRVFLDYTLHRPGETRPKIAPQEWVTERRYNEQELDLVVQGFMAARRSSLEWLRGLDSPNWEATYEAPWGTIRAGDIFAAWTAHDLLHTRQLVRLHWAYNMTMVEPYKVEYAGDW